MAKIAIIGAGGFVFPLRLVGDFLTFPALRDATISLMDVDADRLERTAVAARELVDHYGFPTVVETTTDRRAALAGADYVVLTFQIGGRDAARRDIEIPLKYGVDQAIGDTIGPGGVFRFLRSVNVYRDIAADLHELCPNAQLINYVNPMAMVTWYLTRLGLTPVGLCHSVQGTSRMLAEELGVPYDEVRYAAAGINHQSWFLEFARGGEDLYPRLRETMRERHLKPSAEPVSDEPRRPSLYGGGERVRTAIMDAFGYFHTESSPHASEYLPYFRKDVETTRGFTPDFWSGSAFRYPRDEEGRIAGILESMKGELAPSVEYGAGIVNAMETGTPTVIYGNVENLGLITNLPPGCCVEVACLVDRNGVRPTTVGELPPQCAALNRTNVNVQELAVTAALTGNRDYVYHAVMTDPLTGAMLTLDEIRAMVDELFAANTDFLPAELVRG